ncbi:MAG: aminotransferase class I/II-fold pyridoxal phosphate-dependent enzyme, partial [Oscillospiraceae bacterium]|nr:aminotransferase class I/II-fold pyridoxal phosphate-dependent enzyme [Oscillospiraceae bacterium]
VILYDAAYEAYIHSPGVPHTVFEIPGAETCCIEFHSFSKNAGFTGTRCAYTVVPKALRRGGMSLRDMWNRRQTTKYNGAPYVVQRGAEAVYTPQGQAEMAGTISYYMENAAIIRRGLTDAGIEFCGGIDSPYIWITLPRGLDSWSAFDLLLNEYGVATTPGAGFGRCGEGYIRVTAFGDHEGTKDAVGLIAKALK